MRPIEFTKEEAFLSTLKEYLESEDAHDILKHLTQSKLSFKYSDRFSEKLWNQKTAYVEIKVPVRSKQTLEHEDLFYRLNRYCGDIFEDDEEYGFKGVQIGVLIGTPTEQSVNKDIKYHSKNQVYENLRTKVHKASLNPMWGCGGSSHYDKPVMDGF